MWFEHTAGADDATLALAGMAAMVSGMFTAGGAKWAETASEREAQLRLIEEERLEIKRQPDVEFDELLGGTVGASYLVGKFAF